MREIKYKTDQNDYCRKGGCKVGSTSCEQCGYFVAINENTKVVICHNTETTVIATLKSYYNPGDMCRSCCFFAGPVVCPGGGRCRTYYQVDSFEEEL